MELTVTFLGSALKSFELAKYALSARQGLLDVYARYPMHLVSFLRELVEEAVAVRDLFLGVDKAR